MAQVVEAPGRAVGGGRVTAVTGRRASASRNAGMAQQYTHLKMQQ